MFFALPADWWSWTFGAALSLIFLWMISVPPPRGDAVGAWANQRRAGEREMTEEDQRRGLTDNGAAAGRKKKKNLP
jgi:hypothetical protein